jgi:hypothetical protein
MSGHPENWKELLLAAASSATAAAIDLIEAAREDDFDPRDLKVGETVEGLADATKMAIELSGSDDDESMQLLAALSRFLEGWV